MLGVALPGQVWGLAAPSAAGPVFASSYDGENLERTTLSAVDLSGVVRWQHTVDGHPSRPRGSTEGTVWIAHEHTLTELTTTGEVMRSVPLEHDPHEHLGVFVLLRDGFVVSWLPAKQARVVPPGRHPRVVRYYVNGDVVWSTTVQFGEVSYPGVVHASVATGWDVREKPPWRPRTMSPSYWQPLLVSGDRIAAGFTDYGSGLGVTFFLDTATGEVVARTRPGPQGLKAIIAPGGFLVGEQGYGAFETVRYDRAGKVTQSWNSHAMVVVDRHGDIRGVEYENSVPSSSRFRGLGADGRLRDGPPLSGYYTTYPALDRDGTAVFFRDGRLLAVDADFRVRELFAMPDERRVMSRVLLLDGYVVFALHSELLIFDGTGLGVLEESVWPCEDGNLAGNPVLDVP